MDLLEKFRTYINENALFSSFDPLLVAVSGGVDSVALCELLVRCGYRFTIAHCNFQLRGKESERDEQFVNELAKKYSAEVLVKKFQTESYAAEKKISIQVAARELRYHWFNELIEKGGDPEEIVKAKGLVQISDEGTLRKVVTEILDNNEQSIEDFKNGKDRAIGFLVGQIMKASKGQANPPMVNKILLEEINKR